MRRSLVRRSERKRKTNTVYADEYEDVDDYGNPIEAPKKRARRIPRTNAVLSGPWVETKSACRKLLTTMMNQRYAWPFNEPVDPVKFNLPDYFDKIKQPMDFGTIQSKLEADRYSNATEFASDMKLVFSNCWTYNLPGSDIYIMATSLSELFDKLFKSVKAKEDVASEAQELSHMQQTITQLQYEHQKLLNELTKLKNAPPTATVPPTKVPVKPKLPKRQPKKKVETFGYKQKVALNNRINKLGQDNLQKMVDIIASEINTPKDGELEIDLEKLSVPTLKKLDQFVRNCLKTQQTEQETTKEDEEDPSSSSDSDSSSSSSSDSDSGSDKEADESKPKQVLESEPTN